MNSKYRKIIEPFLQSLAKESLNYIIDLKRELTEEEYDLVFSATSSLMYFS